MANTVDYNIIAIIDEIKAAGTPKMKKEVLEKYKNSEVLKKILYYTMNPYLRYGISVKMFEKYKPNFAEIVQSDFYSLLDELAASNINDALRMKFVNFMSLFPEKFQNIMKGVVTKDLDLGISATTVNKVWPNLIPGFSLQLAARLQHVTLDENEEIWVTEKFDGIRCVCIVSGGAIRFFTRQGKEISGLLDITKDVKLTGLSEIVLDGELLFNGDYIDSGDQYRKTTKIVNSKVDDKKQITFNVFDILSVIEFKFGKSANVYKMRREMLDELYQTENLNVAKVLYHGTDHTQIAIVHKMMVDNNREGVMVNRNKEYECRRTTSLLKVKVMSDVDLRVIDYEEGRGENAGRLGAFVVDYKGFRVNVGSGYSKEQRIKYWEDKDKMIGKIIKVQYFEETKNQQDGLSLRFPVFLELREDKDEPSYE